MDEAGAGGLDNTLTAVGHSHCGCLNGVEVDGFRFELLSFWFLPDAVETVDGERRLGPTLLQRIRAPTISFMGGGAHNVLSLAEHPRPFDFVLPEAPDLPLAEGAEILPYDAVRRRLEADVREFLELTEMVARLERGPVFHVDSPPPVADEAFMSPHIPWQYFPGRKHEVAHRWHRYRMWRLNTDIAREHARRIGVGFIGHARSGEDADGFLDKQYSSDGVHGDETYGRMLAARILKVVRDGRFEDGDFPPDPAAYRRWRGASA